MRTADAVAHWLAEKDISHAYGIIGGGNHILFDAISKAGKTALVCCHHEQAAVMASCYHNRITGGIGSVALVTTGAGSTNAITGVMAAWMDSIPVIVLSGNEASKYMQAPTRVWGVQGYGSSEVVETVTKCAVRPPADEVVSALWMLYDIALKPRQGPVYVDICKDVQNAIM